MAISLLLAGISREQQVFSANPGRPARRYGAAMQLRALKGARIKP